MQKVNILLVPFLLFLYCCTTAPDIYNVEKWKSEILEVEEKFNNLAQQKGIITAFESYAAKDGVIMRNGKLVKGKEAISDWYRNNSGPDQTLSWKPDYVDVSISGDLAYTYGSYVFSAIDSTGTIHESTGSFHTVWKRQVDGNWKFVWD